MHTSMCLFIWEQCVSGKLSSDKFSKRLHMKTPTKKRQKAAVANLTKTRHTLSLHFGQQQTMAKCWWQVDKCRIINRNDDFVPKNARKNKQKYTKPISKAIEESNSSRIKESLLVGIDLSLALATALWFTTRVWICVVSSAANGKNNALLSQVRGIKDGLKWSVNELAWKITVACAQNKVLTKICVTKKKLHLFICLELRFF